jgi:hypothetical protein
MQGFFQPEKRLPQNGLTAQKTRLVRAAEAPVQGAFSLSFRPWPDYDLPLRIRLQQFPGF